MACVQCFKLVQLGRNSKDDLAVCAADLMICEVHLLRWGTAAGLHKADAAKPPEALSGYPETQLNLGLVVLQRIVSIFEKTKDDCQFESLTEGEGNEQSDALDGDEQLKTEDVKLQKSHKFLAKSKAKYRSAVEAVRHTAQSADDRAKWALYKQEHLTALVKEVGSLIDRLEKLFPKLAGVEKKMAREEAEGAEKEVVQVLTKLAAKIDPIMAEALTGQMRSFETTFGDIEAGDQVRAHLGNVYATGEKSTGHDDHTFGKMKLGGHAVIHAGNYYGRKQSPTRGGAESSGN